MESNKSAIQNNTLLDRAKVSARVLLCAASDVDPSSSKAGKFVCNWKQKGAGVAQSV
jgi:hypothetical protein